MQLFLLYHIITKYYIETIEDFDEMKYNNIKELRLPKQEYAILSGIVNSESNIKPGRNYIETTNATYEVYFKDTGEFKVIDKIVDGGYNDTTTNGNIQGTGNTRNAESGLQVHSSTVQQSRTRTRTRNDEISNFNKKRTRISDKSSGNGSSNSSNVKYSIQESENNSGSFSTNSQNNKTWQDYLEKNYKTTGTRTNMQDILVSKATNNNKERVRDILSRNGSFSEQVDKYIADKLPSGDFLYLGETPTVLQNLGLPNNEVILKQSKLKNLMQESNNNTDQLHELPIETIKKILEAIANPLNILQSSTDGNSVVIITDLADANERPIIASIEVNYNGQIGNIDFLSNRLTSAYGKNNYDRFMKTEIAKGNLLYDIDEGIIKELPATRLQSPKGISSFVDTNNNVSTINNNISQNNDSVKSNTIITNNYAQQTQNDTHNNQNVAPRFNFNIRCI